MKVLINVARFVRSQDGSYDSCGVHAICCAVIGIRSHPVSSIQETSPENERLKINTFEESNNAIKDLMARDISADIGIKSIASYLFDPSSCCIHTYLEEGNLFVKKASKYLANVTGYISGEMENANLSILMPDTVA